MAEVRAGVRPRATGLRRRHSGSGRPVADKPACPPGNRLERAWFLTVIEHYDSCEILSSAFNEERKPDLPAPPRTYLPRLSDDELPWDEDATWAEGAGPDGDGRVSLACDWCTVDISWPEYAGCDAKAGAGV